MSLKLTNKISTLQFLVAIESQAEDTRNFGTHRWLFIAARHHDVGLPIPHLLPCRKGIDHLVTVQTVIHHCSNLTELNAAHSWDN